MCRLVAVVGEPMLVADVVLWPRHSIIKQSYDARERLRDPSLPMHLGFGNLNGDGFGIGWYAPEAAAGGGGASETHHHGSHHGQTHHGQGPRRAVDPSPCLFKSITPAWNNENLARLSTKIVSPVIFAHVRAAYPGMPVSEQNCHPFQWGRYLWMHNGVLGGFHRVRRALLATLSDAAYNTVQSFHSDSAVAFSVFLNELARVAAAAREQGAGGGSPRATGGGGSAFLSAAAAAAAAGGAAGGGSDLLHTQTQHPTACEAAALLAVQQPPEVLMVAMQATVATITRVQREVGAGDAPSLLNFVVSDGASLVASRFVLPEGAAAASLYYAEGSAFERQVPMGAGADGGGGSGSGGANNSNNANNANATTTTSPAAAGPSAAQQAAAAAAASIAGLEDAKLAANPCGPAAAAAAADHRAAVGAGGGNTASDGGSGQGGCGGGGTTTDANITTATMGASAPATTAALLGSSILQEADYALAHGPRGARVAMVASEPITGSTTDWIVVPKNVALVVTREKGGFLSVLRAPLRAGVPATAANGGQVERPLLLPLAAEVAAALEAISRGLTAKSRPWTAPRALSLGRRRSQPGGGGKALLELPASPSEAAQRGQHGNSAAAAAMAASPPGGGGGFGGAFAAAAPPGSGAGADGTLGPAHLEEEHRLTGHAGAVLCLAQDPAAGLAWSGGADGAVKVWGMDAMACVGQLPSGAHTKPVTHLALTHGGERLLTASGVAVRVWDVSALRAAAARSAGLGFGGLGAGWAGGDEGAPLPEPALLACVRTSVGAGCVRALVALPDGEGVLVSHQDMTVKRFSLFGSSGAGAYGGGGAPAPPSSAAATTASPPPAPPLQSFAVPATYQPPDVETDPLSPTAHVGPVNALAVCGQFVVSAGGDATVRVWRLSDLSFVRALRGHRGSVLCLLAVGSGGLVLSGARDNTVRVWDLGMDGVCRRTLLGHKDDVVALAAVGVRRRFGGAGGGSGVFGGGVGVGGGVAGMPSTGNLGGGGFGSGFFDAQQMMQYHGGGDAATLARCVSPGPLTGGAAALVASASADGTVRVWSSSWTCLAVLMPNPAPWGPGGGWGFQQQPSSPWSAQQQQQQQQDWGAAFEGGGAFNAASPRPATPLLWSASAAAAAAAAEPPSALTVAVSPDHVTAGFADATVRVWHLDDVFMAAADLEVLLPPNAAADGLLARTLSQTLSLTTGGHGSASALASPAVAVPIQLSAADGALLAGLAADGSGGGGSGGGGAHHGGAAAARAGGPAGRSAPARLVLGSSAGEPTHAGLVSSPPPPPPAPGGADGCAASAVADAAVAAARHAAPPCARLLGLQQHQHDHPHLSSGCCLVCGSQDHALVRALRDFVAIRSVSSDKKARDECLRGAKFLANALESLGADVKVVTPPVAAPDGSTPLPVVMGRLFRDPKHPTLVFYGHYDVQPAEEPDWRTPPFTMVAADGYLYGRGTSDNKGPVLAFIHAVREMHECWRAAGAGAPPVNVAFVLEGEEENGSTGFREALAANRAWFSPSAAAAASAGGNNGLVSFGSSEVGAVAAASAAAVPPSALGVLAGGGGGGGGGESGGGGGGGNAATTTTTTTTTANPPPSLVVVSNTVWVGERRPCLTYGMRGMITLSIEVSGPDRDVHSGNDGGVFVEPMADLVKVLASLTEPGSPAIAVEGFYDAVRAALIDLAWDSLSGCPGEFDAEAYREAIGVRALALPQKGPSSSHHQHGRGGEAEACCGCGGGEPAVASESKEGLAHDVLTARWCQPSLSVIDVRVGEGAVAPGTLVGGCGLGVNEQEDKEIAARGREALRQRLRPGVAAAPGRAEQQPPPSPGGGASGGTPRSSSSRQPQPMPHTPEPRHHHFEQQERLRQQQQNAALSGNYFSSPAGPAPSRAPRHPNAPRAQQHGSRSCYSFGPTRFSVIPRVAVGKVSVRFVPEQDAAALITALAEHVEAAFRRLGHPSSNRVAVRVHSVGDWWEADTASRYFAMAEQAVVREWGVKPLYVREGGTMPVAGVIEAVLGAPALLIPLGQSSDACHLPNERIRRANLVRGKNVFRHCLECLAAMGREP